MVQNHSSSVTSLRSSVEGSDEGHSRHLPARQPQTRSNHHLDRLSKARTAPANPPKVRRALWRGDSVQARPDTLANSLRIAPLIASLSERAPVIDARRLTSSRSCSPAEKPITILMGLAGSAAGAPRRRDMLSSDDLVSMPGTYHELQLYSSQFNALSMIVYASLLLVSGVLFRLTDYHLWVGRPQWLPQIEGRSARVTARPRNRPVERRSIRPAGGDDSETEPDAPRSTRRSAASGRLRSAIAAATAILGSMCPP